MIKDLTLLQHLYVSIAALIFSFAIIYSIRDLAFQFDNNQQKKEFTIIATTLLTMVLIIFMEVMILIN